MTAEDKETLEDGKEALRIALQLASELCEDMALRLGTMPYQGPEDGHKLLLSRAEIEGARKLVAALRPRLLPK